MSEVAFFSFLSPNFTTSTHYADAGKQPAVPATPKQPLWQQVSHLWQQPQALPQSLSQSIQPLANRLLPHEQQLNIDDALKQNQQALKDMVNPLSPFSLLAPDAVILSGLVNIVTVNTAVLRQQQATIKQQQQALTKLYQQIMDGQAKLQDNPALQAPPTHVGKQITVYV
jgi:uncharacterized coiled-coil protein SlyX